MGVPRILDFLPSVCDLQKEPGFTPKCCHLTAEADLEQAAYPLIFPFLLNKVGVRIIPT